jgi:hypothetical protein
MGAICSDCGGDMLVVATCVDEEVELVDGTYPRVRWGFEGDDWGRPAPCGDCGVQLGGIHHWGCDIEGCPRCRGQLLMCDCVPDADE